MSDYIAGLVQKYRRKGILIDTNILLLYIVGSVNREFIGVYKRTNKFSVEDFDTLVSILQKFPIKITTSSILTETSNLLGHIDKQIKLSYFVSLVKGIDILEEVLIKSSDVSKSKIFMNFGLTDSVIAKISRDNYVVLTDDFPLYNYLTSIGIDAINFNHLRNY